MGQGHSHAPPDSRRRLAVVLGLTVTVLVVEVVGAVVSGSLALLADEDPEAAPEPEVDTLYQNVYSEINPHGRLFFDGRGK